MLKTILLALAALITFASCQRTEFDGAELHKLATLHNNAKEYTKSEIRDIEHQLALFGDFTKSEMDDILSEKDAMERKRKTVKLISWYECNKAVFDDISVLVVVLKQSPHTDKKFFEEFTRGIVETKFSLELL